MGLKWTPYNLGGERPWFICPGADTGGGLRFFTGRGAASCAATATTLATRASARTRRTVP
jgi:hypothetical protein